MKTIYVKRKHEDIFDIEITEKKILNKTKSKIHKRLSTTDVNNFVVPLGKIILDDKDCPIPIII